MFVVIIGACSIIQFQDRAFLAGHDVVKNDVLGEDDVMFDRMDGYVVNASIEVGLFHAVSVFLYQAEGSFNAGSERFQFSVDGAVR